jgi:hypothetical protein
MAIQHLSFWEQQEMNCDFDDEDLSDTTHVPQSHISQIRQNSYENKNQGSPFKEKGHIRANEKQQFLEDLNEENFNEEDFNIKPLGNDFEISFCTPNVKDKRDNTFVGAKTERIISGEILKLNYSSSTNVSRDISNLLQVMVRRRQSKMVFRETNSYTRSKCPNSMKRSTINQVQTIMFKGVKEQCLSNSDSSIQLSPEEGDNFFLTMQDINT